MSSQSWLKGKCLLKGLRMLHAWRSSKQTRGRKVDRRTPWDIPLLTPDGVIPQQDLSARADQLHGAADEAARLAQKASLWFLDLGAYLAVIIESTTDVQLLKVSPVTLPLLNAPVPLLGFYVVAPWLLLLIYFNFLLHLTFLAPRLHRLATVVAAFPEARGREEQHLRLFPFPFSALLLGWSAQGRLRLLLALMVVTTVGLVPLLLLLWMQVRFLPYGPTEL